LLKNDGVLPLRPGQKVLVAGDAANAVSRQSGGWTLTWQGRDLTNADFPGATSIYAGVRDAVEAAGGKAVLSEAGEYTDRPDAAIVVFGETPYAEFEGDLETSRGVDFADERPLAILRRLRAAGVPTVAVFLSGRPLYVTPEIEAANAFVAAWLPGSEGAGVADVLIGGADGRPRHDFKGTLSFSWPAAPDQQPLNAGEQPYAPLHPFGFGLRYEARK
ncbi:MAG: glycoside hydrolase family 3 C-terminal domain-containing protein, partial [Hyphomonadaceae bacterium]|nr:glycoside hydrolase family 3 C-terminal domain-containing protein [Hyphomonadaceae bacterium]